MKKEKYLLSRGVVEDFRQVYEDGPFPKEITFEEFLETHAYFMTVKFHLNRMSGRQDPAQRRIESAQPGARLNILKVLHKLGSFDTIDQ